MLQILGVSREHRAFPDTVGGQGLERDRQLRRDPQRNAQDYGIAGEELREAALAHSPTAKLPVDPRGAGDCAQQHWGHREKAGQHLPDRVRGAVEEGAHSCLN